jgi:hypothetical protein
VAVREASLPCGCFGAWRSLASALDWGSRGRRFKSCRPDFWESLENKAYRYLSTVGSAFGKRPVIG